MAQPHKGDRRQVNATLPPGMLELVDTRVIEAGYVDRSEYGNALVDAFLADPAPLAIVPPPEFLSSENAKIRIPTIKATMLKRRALALKTTPTALVRSLIFRDLDLEVSGSTTPVSDNQGVLDLHSA